MSKGDPGAWDDGGLGTPVVRFYLSEGREQWYMWHSGHSTEDDPGVDALFPGSGSVGLAVSQDGLRWQRSMEAVTGERGAPATSDVGRVLGPNAEDWWSFDTRHISVSDVQILGDSQGGRSDAGVYWMFTAGGSQEEAPLPPRLARLLGAGAGELTKGWRTQPGLAMSPNARVWARIETSDEPSGTVLPVGESGEWDAHFIAGPQVVAAGPNDLRMYYYSWDEGSGRFVIGLARSEDGFRWKKTGPIFQGGEGHDAAGATAHCVVQDLDSRAFFMFYEAVAADNTRSIGLAVSPNGLGDWQRAPDPILRAGGEGAWDEGGVGAPWPVSMAAGRWRLYYAGRRAGRQGGAWEGVGCALSVPDAPAFLRAPLHFKRAAVAGAA
ncbi:CGLD10 [Auxenochlorella protothecoides x Auxenochlorella symbiontica]